MKKLFTFLGAIVMMAGSASWAQEVISSAPLQRSVSEVDTTMEDGEEWVPSISFESRFGYNNTIGGDAAGIGGDGLYLNVNGKISKGFSYSLCQKFFSAIGEDQSVFDNTDWMTLSYNVGGFTLSAGKDGILFGGFENDAYDIDSYFDMNSMFYNSFCSYQWGAKAMWTNKSESSSFALQVTTSPFSYAPREENLYSYNLGWYGAWDWYESIWSVNLMEYTPGKFTKVVALGNMFYVGDLSLGFDCIVRGAKFSSLGKDEVTLCFMPSYELGGKVRLFGKAGWERSSADLPYDFWGEYLSADDMMAANDGCMTTLPAFLPANQNYWFYGAGVEYFPIKDSRDVRLHAIWASNCYTARHTINVGVTWKFDVTRAIRRIIKK